MARDVQQENIYERKTKVIQRWEVFGYMIFNTIILHNPYCGEVGIFMVFFINSQYTYIHFSLLGCLPVKLTAYEALYKIYQQK